MDLGALNLTKKADEGAWLTLRHPVTNEPLDARIKLAGTDSAVVRQYERKVANRRLSRALRKGRVKMTADELEEEALDLLVACTLDWEKVEYNGPLEFSKDNVHMLYEAERWVREQVDEFIGDRGSFLPS